MKFGGSLARNDHFGSFFRENCRKHRAKRSFWKLCLMTFGRCLARNDPFGSFFCENCRKHRAKRSFWCFLWNLSEAWHETIILEALWSLARNNHFGSFFCEILTKPRAKRSFWNLLFLNFEEASHETIILEPSSVKIVGSFARNAPEAFSVKIWGSLARNARFGTFSCEISMKPRTLLSPGGEVVLYIGSDFSDCFHQVVRFFSTFIPISHIPFNGRWGCSLHWFWFLGLLSLGGEVFLYIDSDFSHCFHLVVRFSHMHCCQRMVRFFFSLTPISHIPFNGWWGCSLHWFWFLTLLWPGGGFFLHIDSDFSHCFHRAVRFFSTLISMVRHEIIILRPPLRRPYRPISATHSVWKILTFDEMPRFPRKVTLQVHQILRLPRNMTLLSSALLFYSFSRPYTLLFFSLYSTLLFCFLLCYSALYYSVLFYCNSSILLYSLLFFSLLYYSLLFYSLLFYSFLFSALLFSSLLFFTLLFFTLLFPTLLFSTPFFFTLVFFLPLFSTPLFSLLYYSLSFLKLRNSEVSHPNFLW